MRYRLGLIAFSAAVLVAFALIQQTFYGKTLPGGSREYIVDQEAAQLGGPFTLMDKTGTRVSDSDFRGKYMLVYFGFASCPDICLVDLAKMSKLMKDLGDKAANVAPVFITLDPARDSPEKLTEFAKGYDERIVFLTGSEEETEKARSSYKAYREIIKPKLEGDDYMVNHSAFMYVMDKEGKFLTHFNHEQTAEEILPKLSEIVSK